MKANSFDVLKKMSADNKGIRLATFDNIVSLKKVKAGTNVTIGVGGDVVGAIYSGKLTGCLLLWDKEKFEQVKKELES